MIICLQRNLDNDYLPTFLKVEDLVTLHEILILCTYLLSIEEECDMCPISAAYMPIVPFMNMYMYFSAIV